MNKCISFAPKRAPFASAEHAEDCGSVLLPFHATDIDEANILLAVIRLKQKSCAQNSPDRYRV